MALQPFPMPGLTTLAPFSTHPSQLDTPVPSQPLCYQSYPHAFRHTGACAPVSAFDFELSTLNWSFRKSPHQYHSAPLSRPLFSYSYALFCTGKNTNSRIPNHLRTLCAKHPGWGGPAFSSSASQHSLFLVRFPLPPAGVYSGIRRLPHRIGFCILEALYE
jgi:hypothetical protein